MAARQKNMPTAEREKLPGAKREKLSGTKREKLPEAKREKLPGTEREKLPADQKKHSPEQEKRSVALASVSAAFLLTALKLTVGLFTNSLGILSEALHSGLDLMAAGLTYLAVRYASAPPDPGHPYGHGKAENLSALIESLLLLITCFWIVSESVNRLFFNPVPVAPSLWAIGVMLVSIVVDFSRSRLLLRAAKKHHSQALEADALHFSTDILSSMVVLAGLGALYLSRLFPPDSFWRELLEKADAIAALGVSLIIVKVCWSLGKKAVDVLLDSGDSALSARLEAALAQVPGIKGVQSLRLRHSGPDILVDVNAMVDNDLSIDETPLLRAAVVERLQGLEPRAKVEVAFVPRQPKDNLGEYLRACAASHGLKLHAVEILELEENHGPKNQGPKNLAAQKHRTKIQGPEMQGPEIQGPENQTPSRLVELHVELEPELSLNKAHELISLFEKEMRAYAPDLILVTHIEPRNRERAENYASTAERERIHAAIQGVVKQHAAEMSITDCHSIIVREHYGKASVTFHCRMPGSHSVEEAHAASSLLQAGVHKALPELTRVTIHMEPA